MSGEENPKPVNVESRPSAVRSGANRYRDSKLIWDSIQEGMYLQSIRNDDPQLDFYTMYKRETTEYDTEYMQKHNEDLNTTLIFMRVWIPLDV